MYNNDQIITGLLYNDHLMAKHLYKRNYPVISNWIKRNNGSKEASEDIFQEALLLIITKIKAGDLYLDCHFSTYLFSICKNLWLRELQIKKKRVFKNINDFLYLRSEENEYDDTYEKRLEIFLTQLARLDIRCQQILLLCSQNKSVSQIMQIMGFKNAQAVADKKKTAEKR